MKIDSLRSRAILHLAKYRHIDIHQHYGAPLDITQDGVAMALGITRSYASLVLSRLEKTGSVENTVSIIKSSTTNAPRKVYRLTGQGLREYSDLVRMIEEAGTTVDEVLASDLNHLSTDALTRFPKESADTIGLLCVMRRPLYRKDLDGPVPSKVPFDVRGMSYIKDETKKRFLDSMSAEDVCRFHSMAADWCTDHDPEYGERLYHLVMAGRTREAGRIVSSEMYGMIERSDRRLVPTLIELALRGGCPEASETAARIALDNGMADDAERAMGLCTGTDECLTGAMRSELELIRGHRQLALDIALDCYRGDGLTGLALGRCMVANGRYDEAKVYLERAESAMLEEGFVFDLEKVLSLEAEASARTGDRDVAWELVDMTECVMKRKSTRAALEGVRRILGPRVRSEDGVRLQVV